MNLTNKLNFSLTKKRLILIGKRISVAQLYSKGLSALIAFSFSPFLFFNPFTPSDSYTYNIRETYTDIKLQRKSLIAEGDSIYSLAQIPYIVLTEQGEPFSGVENVYSEKTDSLLSSTIYVDGLSVHFKVFDKSGNQRSSLDTFYDAKKTKKTSTRYYQGGSLSVEMVFSSPNHDGKQVLRFWHSDGYLRGIVISETDREKPNTSEMINYDSEGNVIFHERWENEQLVEKIK